MLVDKERKIIIPDELEGMVIPESIAIILDGNGRFAERQGLPRKMGHKAGCEALEVILEETVRIGVKFLTVYAFSTENWKRSEEEIGALMNLFKIYVPKIEKMANENDVRVKFIGDISKFDSEIYKLCLEVEDKTKNNNKAVFSIAFNYGGRSEIVNALKNIINEKISSDAIDEKLISEYLYTNTIKDPDLLIRTSGEYRISNFLLWQIAYSEMYFTDKLWPEFDKNELYKAIIDYNHRERRFGGRIEKKA